MKVLVEGTARQDRSFDREIYEARDGSCTSRKRKRSRSRRSPARWFPTWKLRQAEQEDPPEAGAASQIDDYSKLADTVARISRSRSLRSKRCFGTLVKERLEKARAHGGGDLVLQVEKRIRSRVKRQMEKTQREYYLNEQMKAIQKELGEGEDGRDEAAEIEARIKKTKLPEAARRRRLRAEAS